MAPVRAGITFLSALPWVSIPPVVATSSRAPIGLKKFMPGNLGKGLGLRFAAKSEARGEHPSSGRDESMVHADTLGGGLSPSPCLVGLHAQMPS